MLASSASLHFRDPRRSRRGAARSARECVHHKLGQAIKRSGSRLAAVLPARTWILHNHLRQSYSFNEASSVPSVTVHVSLRPS